MDYNCQTVEGFKLQQQKALLHYWEQKSSRFSFPQPDFNLTTENFVELLVGVRSPLPGYPRRTQWSKKLCFPHGRPHPHLF